MSEPYKPYSTAIKIHDTGCGMTDAVIAIRRELWEKPLCRRHRKYEYVDGFRVCMHCGCVSDAPASSKFCEHTVRGE